MRTQVKIEGKSVDLSSSKTMEFYEVMFNNGQVISSTDSLKRVSPQKSMPLKLNEVVEAIHKGFKLRPLARTFGFITKGTLDKYLDSWSK